jgi:4,5-dihydroxyphthalate decarboxylase
MSTGPSDASASNKLKLRTLLQDRPWTGSLKAGTITSDLLELDFDDISEASKQFKPMVRDMAYDCGELAIVTFLQAKSFGKPLVLLPFVVAGRLQHKNIAYNTERGEVTPATLAGRRVGVRTYSQTTGVWVRGILQNDYGVDLSKVTWVTFEDGHLAEHVDPKNCVRATADKKLAAMLLDGELDAGMLGSKMPKDPSLKPVIANPEQADKDWVARNHVTPVNHMFVVSKLLCESRPDVVRSLFDMLVEASKTAPTPFPIGLDGNWKALELVSQYAYQQGVVSKQYYVDELFAEAAAILDR